MAIQQPTKREGFQQDEPMLEHDIVERGAGQPMRDDRRGPPLNDRRGDRSNGPERDDRRDARDREDDTPIIDMATGEPVAPPLKDDWPVRVKLLHKNIRGPKGEDLNELSFREPTGADINRYGNPCRITLDGDVAIDERKMTLMMGALSGVLSPLLERMDPRDWNSCAYRLRGFFLPDPSAW